MTKAEPLGLSERLNAWVKVLGKTPPDGIRFEAEACSSLRSDLQALLAARSQPIGVVETHFERPESTCAHLVKGASPAPHTDGKGEP